MQIVQFECGCVGTMPHNGVSQILANCENGEPVRDRLMYSKAYGPVAPDWAEELIDMACKAAQFETLQAALQPFIKE